MQSLHNSMGAPVYGPIQPDHSVGQPYYPGNGFPFGPTVPTAYNPHDAATWVRSHDAPPPNHQYPMPELVEKEIVVGDTVQLRGGSNAMTVYKITDEDVGNGQQKYAYVIVWADDQVKEYKLPFSVLKHTGG